jgi:hypothetical protein
MEGIIIIEEWNELRIIGKFRRSLGMDTVPLELAKLKTNMYKV